MRGAWVPTVNYTSGSRIEANKKRIARKVLIAVAKFRVDTCCLPKTNLSWIFCPYHFGDKTMQMAGTSPSHIPRKILKIKRRVRMSPRKIFHPKELDIKILIRKGVTSQDTSHS